MTPTTDTLRAKWNELYKARLDNVTAYDLIAALQAMPHKEYIAQVAREGDWASVGRMMEIALRQMWSGPINRDVEAWADAQLCHTHPVAPPDPTGLEFAREE